jgi:hypothetical protein
MEVTMAEKHVTFLDFRGTAVNRLREIGAIFDTAKVEINMAAMIISHATRVDIILDTFTALNTTIKNRRLAQRDEICGALQMALTDLFREALEK